MDGAEGLRAFETHRSCIDVVLTDVVMPGSVGVEMIGHVRGLAPVVPVMFVSGFTAEDQGLPLDARTVFVPRPYTMASLCAAIEAAVAG